MAECSLSKSRLPRNYAESSLLLRSMTRADQLQEKLLSVLTLSLAVKIGALRFRVDKGVGEGNVVQS